MRHAVASAEFVSDQRDGDLALFCLDPVTGGIGKGVDDVEEKGQLGRLPGDGFRSGEWVRYACPDVGSRRKLGFGVIIAGNIVRIGDGERLNALDLLPPLFEHRRGMQSATQQYTLRARGASILTERPNRSIVAIISRGIRAATSAT